MEEIILKAYAKINLGLDVIRKREDGYHQVRMIMQAVDLCDEISFRRTVEPGIVITADIRGIPRDGSNLIHKAAKLLMDEFDVSGGVSIHLKKVIPVAAGMAGGSTDAAAAFQAVNEIFGLGLSKEALMERAVTIGADLPYCIMGGTALSEGIGEILTPLPAPPDCFLVIAKPDIFVSTKYVYENLHVEGLKKHPNIDGLLEGLGEKDIVKIAAHMENVLETVTVKRYPVIEKIKDEMKKKGALNALMSGSGPTVFGIFQSADGAKEACDQLRRSDLAKQVFLSKFA